MATTSHATDALRTPSGHDLLRFQQQLAEALAGGGARSPAVLGIDPDRLALMAHLAHTKRLGKVARVMPATLGIVVAHAPDWIEAFRVERPLREARSFVNGLEFYRFVCRRLARTTTLPWFGRDLARCEIALAAAAQRVGPAILPRQAWSRPSILVRRNPAAVFRLVQHDIRELLRTRRAVGATVERRPVHLVIVPPARDPADDASAQPRVFELDAAIWRWARTRRTAQRVERGTTTAQGWALLAELTASGVLHVASQAENQRPSYS